MKRQLVVAVSAALVVAAASAALVANAASTSRAAGARHGSAAQKFVGYWMGIDPLDGGDSRRGITKRSGGRFAVIGRDTVFTLCDGTDRAIVATDDARLSGGSLSSDDFVISCTNNGQTIRLKLRYDVVARNIIRETLTSQSGEPVDKIIFHRVSAP
jgi:opacity protein-like surface antigen